MTARFRFHTLEGNVIELKADPEQGTGEVIEHSPRGASVLFQGSLLQANSLFVEQGADLMSEATHARLQAFQAKHCVTAPVVPESVVMPVPVAAPDGDPLAEDDVVD